MKSLLATVCLILGSLCTTIAVHAQTQAECQELFTKATDKVRSLRLLSKKNAFEMTASVIVTPEKGVVVRERIEVVSLGDKYRYKTNQMELYQDAKTMVVLQHDQKSVFMTRPVGDKQRQNQFSEMMKLQDSLQQHLTIRQCTREFGTVQANVGYTKIVFVPGKKLERLGLKSVSYWIDAGTAEVKKISMDYAPGSSYGMKRYELVIEKMNAQTETEPFKGTALEQAMQQDKLKSQWKAYQLIDKRG
ncbi:hypothetical protein KK062_20045 [Fulvivirgaceae bacterium PWU5]|uniref:DUF4412 domain-containing protein n=1 Tax=Dawidia cretensis TaxID=2782350 RepID=A0AAP2GWF4_9BACT|nr:hypothetical protein [Dawidia cretensis]MBT1710547.1 hypothetical protein [Dawidia cretensis]